MTWGRGRALRCFSTRPTEDARRSIRQAYQGVTANLQHFPSGYCRSSRINALKQGLPALEACGLNVLVQDLLEQVMHWHFVAMISRKLCMKRAQGGWSYPNPGCKRLQILAEFLQIFLVFACIL